MCHIVHNQASDFIEPTQQIGANQGLDLSNEDVEEDGKHHE